MTTRCPKTAATPADCAECAELRAEMRQQIADHRVGQEALRQDLERVCRERDEALDDLAQERKLVEFLEEESQQTMHTLRRESASLSSLNWLVSKLRLADALAECDGCDGKEA